LEQQTNKTNVAIARSNVAHALTLKAERNSPAAGTADIGAARELYSQIARDLDKQKNPRLWAAVKQNEAELLRLIGKREAEPKQSFQSLKASFELYQEVLTVVSKETAPNTWAMLCAELGHTIVAALPLITEADRDRMSRNALAAFGAARPYFVAGGFGQDLERLEEGLRAAQGGQR
jgi:thiamine pyrophosphate-dependent acetolactate synthase large subunit-like protein